MKRPRTRDKNDIDRYSKMNHFAPKKISQSPMSSSSEQSSDEAVDNSDEAVASKDPSMYDNLLSVLGSGNDSFKEVYKWRQRELSGSAIKEDGNTGAESGSESEEDNEVFEEENSDGGSDYEPKSHVQNEASNYFPDDLVAQSEEDDIGEEDDASDEDHAMSVPQGTSSFNDHFGRILAEAEVDNLKKRKWRYKWEMPAMDMSMSKWVGTGDPFLEEVDSDSGYDLKLKLYKHWLDVYKTSGSRNFHTSKQRRFFSLCNSYRDILHCNKKPFYLKGVEEDSSIMDGYVIHALNHVFKTRDLVTKNDAKLAKHQEHTKEEILNDDGFLDQGFTRPKVLILLPFRSIALRVVKRLIQLTPSSHKVNVEYMDRFSNEFGKGQEEDDDDEIFRSQKTPKPADHQALLGGNNDDCFMVGIKFTKRSIKLFSDFYSSDMIIASPVALITKMGKAKFEKENDVDYLSSIEILIIDHADVMTTFQKWSHLYMALKQLNRLPVKQHGTDVMRIRQWYLDGHAQFYRQTILLGSFLNPDIDSMFSNLCLNYQGKVKLVSECKGVLSKVLLQVRQVYEQFDATSFADDYDARFNFFTKKVFPKVQDSTEGGTLIFISSYLEYVRLRNFFRSQKASFCKLMDFSKQSDISRARVWFFHGKRKSMLYTERAYFCYRYKIRGIKNLIIYSLPERKEFYPEIVNMLEESTNMSCTVLFSRFDRFRLERIVGTPSAKRMLSSNKEIFVFS